VIEMNMREQQVPEVADLEPALVKTGAKGVHRARRAAIEQREAVVGVDEVRGKSALATEVLEVDGASWHGRTIGARS
jgi:hypothetical protein